MNEPLAFLFQFWPAFARPYIGYWGVGAMLLGGINAIVGFWMLVGSLAGQRSGEDEIRPSLRRRGVIGNALMFVAGTIFLILGYQVWQWKLG